MLPKALCAQAFHAVSFAATRQRVREAVSREASTQIFTIVRARQSLRFADASIMVSRCAYDLWLRDVLPLTERAALRAVPRRELFDMPFIKCRASARACSLAASTDILRAHPPEC